MTSYDALIAEIIHREGGFVDRPSDRGGATCWGITERVARGYGYTGPMNALPQATAHDIYRKQYISEPGIDQVITLSDAIAREMFDTGVIQGPKVAIRYLQRSLTAFNNRGKYYPDLVLDGVIGFETLSCLKVFLHMRGREGERVLVAALNGQQCADFLDLAVADATQEDYVYGWILNRVATP